MQIHTPEEMEAVGSIWNGRRTTKTAKNCEK
jgi:hypothetical protein